VNAHDGKRLGSVETVQPAEPIPPDLDNAKLQIQNNSEAFAYR
jgi:hypothetical protein